MEPFASVYRGRKVLLTGHTGFKGSWLALWLKKLGADVTGYSLAPNTDPSHFDLLKLEMESIIGDIRDRDKLAGVVQQVRPEIVFHLAAQPIVRASYEDPFGTYETNVMGTLSVFEACRRSDSVCAVVNVTSDKCYENREWVWGYRENDPMGGSDPYSSSKGCAEILATSYRRSYWKPSEFGKSHNCLMASVRAGNVIGGGDWAEDRLIPDVVRAASRGEKVVIRNPGAIRPWQHVLEPLRGYLMIGERLLKGDVAFAEGWNFGPLNESCVTVEELLKALLARFESTQWEFQPSKVPEAHFLRLDSTKAYSELGWAPALSFEDTIRMTAEWYHAYLRKDRILSHEQLDAYIAGLKAKN